MFWCHTNVIYNNRNTLAASLTTGEAAGGAYVIDTLLHFACVFAHFACILTHFPLKINRISYRKVMHFSPKTESDGFLAKNERPDGSYSH